MVTFSLGVQCAVQSLPFCCPVSHQQFALKGACTHVKLCSTKHTAMVRVLCMTLRLDFVPNMQMSIAALGHTLGGCSG